MATLQISRSRVLAAVTLAALLAAHATAQPPPEPPQLYGAGTDAKGDATYFRVRLPSATAVDIGPDAFKSTPAPLPVVGPLPTPIVPPEGWTIGEGTANRAGTFMYVVGYDATAQERPPRLFGYYIQPYFMDAGQLGLSLPIEFPEGPGSIVGLFAADSETGDLYGYGTSAKGEFTYFRFTLEEAEAQDIGPGAFRFPQDATYDPVHDVHYDLNGTGPGIQETFTLSVTDGRTGDVVQLGSVPELDRSYAEVSLAYAAATGFLYAAVSNPNIGSSFYQISPTTLAVTQIGAGEYSAGIGGFCFNPKTGALYGLDGVNEDNITWGVASIDLQSGAIQSVLGFPRLFTMAVPAVDPSGRYFYGVGYQPWPNTDWGFSIPPHLLIYDLEAKANAQGGNDYLVYAPLLNIGDYAWPEFPQQAAIGELFFALPPP
jgi:hypothetical protein